MPDLTIITGAAGFIGRNTVAALNAQGRRELVLVDSLGQSAKWKNLIGLDYEDLLQPGDLLPLLLSPTGRHVTSIVHLGACSSTTETDADYLLENNYRYTRRLCEWAVERGVRFVYASSAATYGDGSAGYRDDDATTRRLRPLNMYGYSKHMFDLWALRRSLLDRIVGLKFFNVYGPFEDHKGDMRSVVAKAYDQIVATGSVSLFRSYRPEFADGEQRRDFIHVDDAVGVVLQFLSDPAVSGLFNCGTGRARTWLDLAGAVFAAMDCPPNIVFIDMPSSVRDQYQYATEATTDKLRAAGFTAPFTELEDGIDRYVRGYLAVSR
jgi:ADP-L-glycero-D-manno-heptose 6-epimerase